ncbi:MAG: spore coat protein CotJB [Bacilli bacterium]
MENKNLYDENEAIIKGTVFKDFYKPYKNYTGYTLPANNEQQSLLNEISKYEFMLLDLRFALILDPNNKEYLVLYDKYFKNYLLATDNYEKKYGKLNAYGINLQSDEYSWINDPWTWEVL